MVDIGNDKLFRYGKKKNTHSCYLFRLQTDANGLTVENNELKLRLQTMEQQVHLQDGKDLI